MRNYFFILLFLVLTIQSCKKEDCDLCFTPPNVFLFELVDKTTGENLFTNGTYNINDLKITNSLNNNAPFEYEFITENDINLIQVYGIGWKTEKVNLNFEISNNYIFSLYVDAERKKDDCCSYTSYKEISINDIEFEIDSETGAHRILVE